jgi:predicted RNA methylase
MAYYGEEYNGKDVYYPEGFNINMVNQDQRLLVYQKAFNEISVHNKVVCDLGAGTGLLGLEALRQGATHLYLVEMVPESIQPLKSLLLQKIYVLWKVRILIIQ